MAEGPTPAERVPAAERLASAYKRLAASAEILNKVSDDFAAPIAELDTGLQKLNLGLTVWEKVAGGEDENDNFWRREVGYARINGTWGLALRKLWGNANYEDTNIEEWPFNNAPRSHRIEAIDKLPDLLEELIKKSEKATKKIREKTAEAQQLALALRIATDEIAQPKKERK